MIYKGLVEKSKVFKAFYGNALKDSAFVSAQVFTGTGMWNAIPLTLIALVCLIFLPIESFTLVCKIKNDYMISLLIICNDLKCSYLTRDILMLLNVFLHVSLKKNLLPC